MLENISKKSLVNALKTYDLRELPEVEDGENIWIRALALVDKLDGTQSYVYVEKNELLGNSIKRDFGSSAAINKVIAYYPISYLKETNMPMFKTQKKEERIKYLANYQIVADEEMSLKELNRMIKWNAIKRQLEQEKYVEKLNNE